MDIGNEIDVMGKVRRYFFRDYHLENVFRKTFGKRVLLSYITAPFVSGIDKRHTNNVEAVEIAKVFDELGYVVDVYDYTYNKQIDFDRYDVVFGFEMPLINSFFSDKKGLIGIMYGTGRHPYVSGPLSLQRIKDVYENCGVLMLESARLVNIDYALQTSLVDGIICLGDEYCKESWSNNFARNRIYNVSPTFYKVRNFDKSLQDVKKIRKNYLWFGSSGLIHKGLDLVLEAFKDLQNLNLYVCGPVDKETKFAKVFEEELFRTKNIQYLGFVGISSSTFNDLMKKCGYVIFPSCSEGGSPSVATVIGNGGLFPIITRETTLDVDKKAVYIKELNIKSVIEAVRESQKVSDQEYWEATKRVHEYINNKCNISNFHSSIKNAILDIIK